MKFKWPAYPDTQLEFEELMSAIDNALSEAGLEPSQRPLHVGRKLWEAFGWGGNIFPPSSLSQQPGFSGDILMAKAHEWYEISYGEKLKTERAFGFAPARLGNALWRVRATFFYGTVGFFLDTNLANEGVQVGINEPASCNVLCEVEGLTQGFVNRLDEQALENYYQFFMLMQSSLEWRDQLPDTDLLKIAHHDYDESTASVLAGRHGQSRWASQQAVEKTLKGLLTLAGTSFPTGGPNGHNLRHIAKILDQSHGIHVHSHLLELAECSPNVRYGKELSSENQALQANHAVLGVLDQLRKNRKTQDILARTDRSI